MKAVLFKQYGEPELLELQNIEKPFPTANEVLVQIFATPVTAADTLMRQGVPYFARFFLGWPKPSHPIPGTGFAGRVEAVGSEVTEFKPGDEVFGETALGFSTNAQYVCVPADGVIAKKPGNISFAEAATICDGPLTSLNFLREIGQLQPGQKVLIIGASGSLGMAAVQLALHFGAHVTGVCSTRNLGLVRSLGAQEVIDYTTTDFTQTDQTFDLIYDAIGQSSFQKCQSVLSAKGVYLCPVLSFSLLLAVLRTSLGGAKKAKFSATGLLPIPKLRALLDELAGLLRADIIRPHIDRTYFLEEVVAAHKYVDSRRKRGNVVLLPQVSRPIG